MHVLVVFQNPKFVDLLSFFLKGHFDIETNFALNLTQCVEKLSDLKNPTQVVVCELNELGKQLIAHAIAKKMNLTFLCSTEKVPSTSQVTRETVRITFFERAALIKTLCSVIEDNLKEGLFFEVKKELLLLANPMKGNIYGQIAENKFMRVMHAGENFSLGALNFCYREKNFEKFYIKRTDCLSFATQILANLYRNERDRALQGGVVNQTPKLTREDREKQEEERKLKEEERLRGLLVQQLEQDLGPDLELLQEASRKLGFTKEVQAVTRKNVMMTVKAIKTTPKLSLLLKKIRRDREKYVSAHSVLQAYISCALAVQMDWTSDVTYQKLVFASFLHDILLVNHELAALQTLKDFREKEHLFPPTEVQTYLNHPLIIAEIARHFPEIPPDVDTMLAQHHERPDGSGFPRGIAHPRIAPLSAVFIVAHDLVSYIFEPQNIELTLNRSLIEKFVKRYAKTRQVGHFRKLLLLLPKILG